MTAARSTPSVVIVGATLRREIKQPRRVQSLEAEAFVNLLRTSSLFVRQLNDMLRKRGLDDTFDWLIDAHLVLRRHGQDVCKNLNAPLREVPRAV